MKAIAALATLLFVAVAAEPAVQTWTTNNQHYFRITTGTDGGPACRSEGYKSEDALYNGIAVTLARGAAKKHWSVEDAANGKKKCSLKGANNKIVCACSNTQIDAAGVDAYVAGVRGAVRAVIDKRVKEFSTDGSGKKVCHWKVHDSAEKRAPGDAAKPGQQPQPQEQGQQQQQGGQQQQQGQQQQAPKPQEPKPQEPKPQEQGQQQKQGQQKQKAEEQGQQQPKPTSRRLLSKLLARDPQQQQPKPQEQGQQQQKPQEQGQQQPKPQQGQQQQTPKPQEQGQQQQAPKPQEQGQQQQQQAPKPQEKAQEAAEEGDDDADPDAKDKNHHFWMNLVAANGQIIMTASQVYKTKAGLLKGLGSCMANGHNKANFESKKSDKAKQPFHFNLLAENKKVIGKSEMYKTKQGRDKGIEAVRHCIKAIGKRVSTKLDAPPPQEKQAPKPQEQGQQQQKPQEQGQQQQKPQEQGQQQQAPKPQEQGQQQQAPKPQEQGQQQQQAPKGQQQQQGQKAKAQDDNALNPPSSFF